ncbi:MAG: 5'/3'-nucleotidase SurE [Betaproteobacteria bacterium]|nr:5'/3'-nucleotidase SurE [Betaproteobacteria bacterium]
MRILVSNDDGYLSPGLARLAEVMARFGSVTVVAPDRDRSGASNSLTLDAPLTVRKAANGFHFVNGTPTDCVHMAITGLLEHRPDLVVSGINNGPNMGDDTIYSGTVAAAMEGYLLGVPSIAFSLQSRSFHGLDRAGDLAASVVQMVLRRHPFAPPYLLNVNIPGEAAAAGDATPLVTRLGKRHVAEPVIAATNPRGEDIWWIGPAGPAKDAGPGTDFHALSEGRASITPLDIDLTAHRQLGALAQWLHGQD